ncbi:Retinol dehydrogenase 14, partial [Colletotrichum shisoi]
PKTTGTELVAEYAEHISGKTILVTGVSPGGLGANFAEKTAAAAPALLILAGRNTTKTRQTADAITAAHPGVDIMTLELDLGSFRSVRRAAETVNGWADVPKVDDVLVNNAGIMATPSGKTEDGFESQFGTNHLGPFLFTNLVMGKVQAAEAPRVVTDGKHYNEWHAYGQSKTANCLVTISLAEKLGGKGLLSLSLHPGAIFTNLSNHLENFEACRGEGAQDINMGTKFMWTDFDPKTEDRGVATHSSTANFFKDCRVADQYSEEVYPWATNKIDADKPWTLSERLVGERFSY